MDNSPRFQSNRNSPSFHTSSPQEIDFSTTGFNQREIEFVAPRVDQFQQREMSSSQSRQQQQGYSNQQENQNQNQFQQNYYQQPSPQQNDFMSQPVVQMYSPPQSKEHSQDMKYEPNYIPPLFDYSAPPIPEEDRNGDVEEITYRIKELDVNQLRPRNVDDDGVKYAMIGKPGTGKSSLIKAYMHAKRHIFPVGIFCNGTEDSTQFFTKHAPDLFIHPLSITLVEAFIKRQKIARQHLSNPWSLFITDDCMDDTKIFTKPPFKYLFKNGRHLKMSYIMSLQYSIDVKPDIRACIDGTFILRESNERFRKNLYENYASIIPSYSEFKAILDGITGDYTSLFIDNRSTSNNVEDCVYYYKANLSSIDPDFKFGCPEYWDFSKQRYNPNYVIPF